MSEAKCTECDKVYRHSSDLRKHVKRIHKEKLNQSSQSSVKEKKRATQTYKFNCEICHKNFSYQKHLTFHKKVHGIVVDPATRKSRKKCPLCDFKGTYKTEMHNHFRDSHNIEVCSEKFEFPTEKDFEEWKYTTEYSSKSKYVKESGDVKSKTKQHVLRYTCHRSGFYKSKSQNKRLLKTQGSSKIGAFCPSEMKVLVTLDGQCKVNYVTTHVGHEPELVHLQLTPAERKDIAAKIADKVPFSRILSEFHADSSEGPSKRIDLLTKKDLHNIAAAFNLRCEAVKEPRLRTCKKSTRKPRAKSKNKSDNVITQASTVHFKSETAEGVQEEAEQEEEAESSGADAMISTEYANLVENLKLNEESSRILQQDKEDIKRWFCDFVDSIESSSHFDIFRNLVAPIESRFVAEITEQDHEISAKEVILENYLQNNEIGSVLIECSERF